MAKRSREDFEPLTPVSGSSGDSTTSTSPYKPEGVKEQTSSSKITHLDLPSGQAGPATQMYCSLPPHRETLSFTSYEEYEVHYNQAHVNRCLECRKNFPTGHFLNLHIEENHDALVSVRKERGEKTVSVPYIWLVDGSEPCLTKLQYSCFVEDCDRKCSTPQKRRMHLIDKHLFPKEYDFYVINDGIDHRCSLLRSGRQQRRSSTTQHMADANSVHRRDSSTLKSTSEDGQDMEGLTGAMSALNFVPPSVRFGRRQGGGRGGFSKT